MLAEAVNPIKGGIQEKKNKLAPRVLEPFCLMTKYFKRLCVVQSQDKTLGDKVFSVTH